MNLLSPKVNLHGSTINQKYLEYIFNNIKSRLIRLSLTMCLFSFTLLFSQNTQAQTYGETVTFGSSNQYSFDYTIVCSGDGTTATLTVDFTVPPPGIVPQIHLGGGAFVGMSGPNPYTYQFTGLTACDFSFQFWMAYAGGLYSSSFMNPANTPLPIELSNFSATKDRDRTVSLDWVTSTEINSDYFGIERSSDGVNWKNIDQVKAAGDSNIPLSYSYLDTDLQFNKTSEAKFYYRLKLTDLDGSYKYSDIRGVTFEKEQNSIISVYPNPTTDRINVDLTDIDMEAGGVQISMYNDSGREVIIKKVNGNGIELLDVANLPSTVYYIIVKQGLKKIYQASIVKVD